MCFNCGRSNHRADQCRRRGYAKRKYKHHRSICDRPERESSNPDGVSLTFYSNYAEEKVLTAIIPDSIEGQVLGSTEIQDQDVTSFHVKQSV